MAMTTVLCRAYTSHDQARRAVDALLAAGVPGTGLRVLTGERTRDVRDEQVGEFAHTVGPDAPVGTFGGTAAHRPAAGAFACDGEQRGGSFADADRDLVITFPEGVEHMRVAGHRSLHRLLVDAGLDGETAARDVEALHAGRILVLADAGALDPARAAALLDT